MKEWIPDRPVSSGAAAYHDAVVDAPYYIQALEALAERAVPFMKKGQTVVDFGAGTGVSGLQLLKKLKSQLNLWLVDNSAAWLGKAHDVFKDEKHVNCMLLNKHGDIYDTLAQTTGKNKLDHVVSGNTVHLIDDLQGTFKGIYEALKEGGNFFIESGNIIMDDLPEGALLIDGTVQRVHDNCMSIIKSDPKFAEYKKDLLEKEKEQEHQRKFVFPDPRPLSHYHEALQKAGFTCGESAYHLFKVKYDEWLAFLRVQRLQAGILPEIGGHHPTEQQAKDRDEIITRAAQELFKDLEQNNALADSETFTIVGVYIDAKKEQKELKGKTALVTGASKGIGREIALELARSGANIVLNYNSNAQKAQQTVEDIEPLGVKCLAVQANISSRKETQKMANQVQESFEKIDILVNNAGIIRDRTFEKMSDEEWHEVIQTNLTGSYNATKAMLPLMNQGGSIMFISSIVGIYGNVGQANYAASKAGLIGFAKSLAKEQGKRQIRVNTIAPGFIDSDLTRTIPDEVKKKIEEAIPLKHTGLPEDVAHAALFLASEKSSYITGEIINVNGGLTL